MRGRNRRRMIRNSEEKKQIYSFKFLEKLPFLCDIRIGYIREEKKSPGKVDPKRHKRKGSFFYTKEIDCIVSTTHKIMSALC